MSLNKASKRLSLCLISGLVLYMTPSHTVFSQGPVLGDEWKVVNVTDSQGRILNVLIPGGNIHRVGMGTDKPGAMLHVKGDENNGSTAPLKITSGVQTILIDGNEIDAIADGLYLNNNSGLKVVIGTGGGNVGIGTTSPSSKLTVSGVIESKTGGLKFPDGTIQKTAQLRGDKGDKGEDGEDGDIGPPGPPTTTSAVCVNADSLAGNATCTCNVRTVSRVVSPCEVTSDTGSCRGSGFGSGAAATRGQCCVCAPG